MRPQWIELIVDELVLEGVDAGARDRMVASLERELAQRLARGERPRVSQASIVAERPAELGPVELGAHVARTLVQGGDR